MLGIVMNLHLASVRVLCCFLGGDSARALFFARD
jgi:hypothetical protein